MSRPRTPPEEIMQKLKEKCQFIDECWIWIGHINNAGYPIVYSSIRRRMTQVKNLMWALTKNGEDRPKMLSTSCGNKRCVNPEHIIEISLKEMQSKRKEIIANNNREKKLGKA